MQADRCRRRAVGGPNGASAARRSARSSTSTPPAPTITTGPNCGSRHHAERRLRHPCSMRATRATRRAAAHVTIGRRDAVFIREVELHAADVGLVQDAAAAAVFSTTGYPSRVAAATACSSFVDDFVCGTTGMPQADSSARLAASSNGDWRRGRSAAARASRRDRRRERGRRIRRSRARNRDRPARRARRRERCRSRRAPARRPPLKRSASASWRPGCSW